jgi:hypothetical protein
VITDDRFDRDFWERRWSQALRVHPDKVAARPPNAHLLAPGKADSRRVSGGGNRRKVRVSEVVATRPLGSFS